jgi:hypothetical protein
MQIQLYWQKRMAELTGNSYLAQKAAPTQKKEERKREREKKKKPIDRKGGERVMKDCRSGSK